MKFFLLLFSLLLIRPAFAQQDSTTQTNTTESPFVKKVKKIGADGEVESRKKFKEEQDARKQIAALESIRKLNHQAKLLLKKAVDTNSLNQFLQQTKKLLELIKEGIWINQGSNQTQRNLAVSSALLVELSSRLDKRKQLLDDYCTKLTVAKFKTDSLLTDPSLFAFPDDSAALVKFIKRMYVTDKEMSPVDTVLEKTVGNLEELQLKTNILAFELKAVQEDIEIYSAKLSANRFKREFPNLWDKPTQSRPIKQILEFSLAKESIMLQFYLENHQFTLLILVAIILCSWYFLRSLKHQLREEKLLNDDYMDQLVIRHPLLSATLISISIFQFMFPSAPFIFSLGLWIISAICLWIIFKGHITVYWQRFWTVIILFFLVASIDNMVLQASRIERYIMFILSLSGAIYTAFILNSAHRFDLREKKIKYAIIFLLILQASAVLFNLFGRFNISKTLLISGYVGVLTAILFLWVIRLINQGLTLAFKAYKQPTPKLFYVNFDRVGENAPWPLYLIFIIGWITLVARNFYSFRKLSGPFIDFLTSDRTIGSYSFSIMGLLVFVIIIISSFILSRLVSYFASEPDLLHQGADKRKKTGLGSWLLIIRIFIISLGLFFAFAAAGIPMDKFAIILGALGVGVGLGLQGLVNNLISGLIISFERPVNVGDTIEVNGKIATMKSIGFRSSIVSSSDGPNVIIPNGELLSQQLINYSMGKNIKRCSLVIGIAYDSDLEHVKAQLKLILEEDQRILQYPPPDAFFKEFGNSAIEIEVIYWARNIKEYLSLRSDVIAQINAVFKAEGINIPFPQQDVYIKSIPDTGEHKKSSM
ncbi:mechanosensitive ion channel domain-containing protein [Pedobacter frigoris]|uniref:mechanosensitive ion channel domain-containing protein n=1 Tax=Pedobacter frigoris TaxID=2571272 RepID=UPI00292D5DEF|nr:mechanosensitive ion channel domain-containing protein [Pedobacter frigoris]